MSAERKAKIMSARTVITHALNQGTNAPLVWDMGGQGLALVVINTDKVVALCDFCDGPSTYAVQAPVEGAWRYLMCRVHAEKYARKGSHGVSLAKVTDGAPVGRPEGLCGDVLRGCAHTAVMDESGVQVACGPVWVRSSWTLRANGLDALAAWFAGGRA